jgi:hypothetical protein
MDTPKEFLKKLTGSQFNHVDRAVAVLWLYELSGSEEARAVTELASEIEAAGYARQNATRLATQLNRDRRVVKKGRRYKVNIESMEALEREFGPFLGPRLPAPTDSVLPFELFFDTRTYLEKVVRQANAAYDAALYDCCAVMLRRTMETLIIEVYEQDGREAELKGSDGNYLFLSGLVNYVKADKAITLSRNTLKALDDAKRLGDLSAHNRRYNAVKDDIDRVRDGIRTAAQELLVAAGMR